jgi:hypothetical protein
MPGDEVVVSRPSATGIATYLNGLVRRENPDRPTGGLEGAFMWHPENPALSAIRVGPRTGGRLIDMRDFVAALGTMNDEQRLGVLMTASPELLTQIKTYTRSQGWIQNGGNLTAQELNLNRSLYADIEAIEAERFRQAQPGPVITGQPDHTMRRGLNNLIVHDLGATPPGSNYPNDHVVAIVVPLQDGGSVILHGHGNVATGNYTITDRIFTATNAEDVQLNTSEDLARYGRSAPLPVNGTITDNNTSLTGDEGRNMRNILGQVVQVPPSYLEGAAPAPAAAPPVPAAPVPPAGPAAAPLAIVFSGGSPAGTMMPEVRDGVQSNSNGGAPILPATRTV